MWVMKRFDPEDSRLSTWIIAILWVIGPLWVALAGIWKTLEVLEPYARATASCVGIR